MNLEEFNRRLAATADSMEPTAREALIRLLSIEEDEQRAKAIGYLHADGRAPQAVELMIDLHDDHGLGRLLAVELRRASRRRDS
jgi:hypothetical protein